jgi:hypothetical protein
MWFCVKCRKIAEEYIIIDLKIEKGCKEIMENYEQRISDIESEMTLPQGRIGLPYRPLLFLLVFVHRASLCTTAYN